MCPSFVAPAKMKLVHLFLLIEKIKSCKLSTTSKTTGRIYTYFILHTYRHISTKTYNDVMIWYDNIQNISFYRVFVSFFGYFCNLEIWQYVNYENMMKMPFYKSTKGRDMAKMNKSITYVMRCFFDIHFHYNWISRCF